MMKGTEIHKSSWVCMFKCYYHPRLGTLCLFTLNLQPMQNFGKSYEKYIIVLDCCVEKKSKPTPLCPRYVTCRNENTAFSSLGKLIFQITLVNIYSFVTLNGAFHIKKRKLSDCYYTSKSSERLETAGIKNF